jgi:hypothetical protein
MPEALLRKPPPPLLLRKTLKGRRGEEGRVSGKTRVLRAGEVVGLVGEVMEGSKRWLECLDNEGQTLFLPTPTAMAKVSPLARSDSISGLQTTT